MYRVGNAFPFLRGVSVSDRIWISRAMNAWLLVERFGESVVGGGWVGEWVVGWSLSDRVGWWVGRSVGGLAGG